MIISVGQTCNDTNASFFKCEEGTSQCIPWPWVCDNDRDCSDGSDESQDLCKYSGKCGGNFNSTIGFLTSPSYPDEYPLNAECIYIISQPAKTFIQLTIRMFDLGMYICTGSLEIRDGRSEDSQLIGTFCGSTFPGVIQLTQNQLWMK